MYIETTTEEIYTLQQLRQEHKNVSFPATGASEDWLEDNGYAPFTVLPMSETDEGFIAEEDGVEQVEGTWQTKWVIRAMIEQEIADKLLHDWQSEIAATDAEVMKQATRFIEDFYDQNPAMPTRPEFRDVLKKRKEIRSRKPK